MAGGPIVTVPVHVAGQAPSAPAAMYRYWLLAVAAPGGWRTEPWGPLGAMTTPIHVACPTPPTGQVARPAEPTTNRARYRGAHLQRPAARRPSRRRRDEGSAGRPQFGGAEGQRLIGSQHRL